MEKSKYTRIRLFDEENLEWTEETSREYQDYLKKKQDDIDSLTMKLNPHISFIRRND